MVKAYRAPNMPAALAQIRTELGADALILETRWVRRGGGSTAMLEIEVVASNDPEDRASGAADAAVAPGSAGPVGNAAVIATATPRPAATKSSASSNGPIETTVASSPSPMRPLWNVLRAQAVDEGLALELITAAVAQNEATTWTSAALARQAIAGQIEQRIHTTGPLRFRKGGSKILAIAGPTGVGKTTTVAKLAAAAITRGKKVSLVNLDTYKTGATQQIRSYAELLGIPLYVAYNPPDLGDILADLRDSDLVLLDMPGCGARNQLLIAESKEFLRQVRKCRVHLAIACTMHYGAMLEVASAFSDLSIDAVVLTKIDEATHLGPALSLVHKLGKPVSFLTTGQGVPADLEVATAKRLAELLVAHEVAA